MTALASEPQQGRITELDHHGHRLRITAQTAPDGAAHCRIEVCGEHVSDTPLGTITIGPASDAHPDLDAALSARLGLAPAELTAQVARIARADTSTATGHCPGTRSATGAGLLGIGA